MLDGAQKFHAVALFLQGIVRRGDALHRDFAGLQLKGLLGLRRQHQGAADDQRRAHVLPGDLIVIFQAPALKDHLQRLEAAAVVELDKAEILHIPHGADPAAYRELPAAEALGVGIDPGNLLMLQHETVILSSYPADTRIFCIIPNPGLLFNQKIWPMLRPRASKNITQKEIIIRF